MNPPAPTTGTQAAVAVNGRFLNQPLTGVQRVAREIVGRLADQTETLSPGAGTTGALGHAWEQGVLPLRLRGRLLWSPCNVGPVAVAHQILTIHDAALLDNPAWFSGRFVSMYRLVWKTLARRAARLVTVSTFSRDRLSYHLGVPPSAIDVVHNGVSKPFGVQSAQSVAQAAADAGLVAGRYFVTLGTLEPRKNLGLVFQAWEQVRSRLPTDTKLAVIGGRGAASIFSKTGLDETGEDVLWLGSVGDDRLPQLLAGSIALLYPSLYEGFGLPVLEAMACGTAVVTTARTSLPEVGGDAAIYVDAEAPEELACAMQRLAESDDLRQACRELGLARAAGFTWAAAAERMSALFKRYG